MGDEKKASEVLGLAWAMTPDEDLNEMEIDEVGGVLAAALLDGSPAGVVVLPDRSVVPLPTLDEEDMDLLERAEYCPTTDGAWQQERDRFIAIVGKLNVADRPDA